MDQYTSQATCLVIPQFHNYQIEMVTPMTGFKKLPFLFEILKFLNCFYPSQSLGQFLKSPDFKELDFKELDFKNLVPELWNLNLVPELGT